MEYTNTLQPAEYPNYQALEYRDYLPSGHTITETFVITANPWRLKGGDIVDLPQSLSVQVENLSVWNFIEFDQTPSVNAIALDIQRGLIKFHPTHIGKTCVITYKSRSSVILAQDFHRINAEILEHQTIFENIPGTYVSKSGDTMTGDLTISKNNPKLILSDTSPPSSISLISDGGKLDIKLGNTTIADFRSDALYINKVKASSGSLTLDGNGTSIQLSSSSINITSNNIVIGSSGGELTINCFAQFPNATSSSTGLEIGNISVWESAGLGLSVGNDIGQTHTVTGQLLIVSSDAGSWYTPLKLSTDYSSYIDFTGMITSEVYNAYGTTVVGPTNNGSAGYFPEEMVPVAVNGQQRYIQTYSFVEP